MHGSAHSDLRSIKSAEVVVVVGVLLVVGCVCVVVPGGVD